MDCLKVQCLPCCALIQEKREVHLRGGYEALKSAIMQSEAEIPKILSGMSRS